MSVSSQRTNPLPREDAAARSGAWGRIESNMLIEFDQNTIANMTAALDYVCKKIPADRDRPNFEGELPTN